MPTVNLDIDMYYEIHGEGEPLVLINGLGLDISSWMPQVPSLSQKFRVVLFDNRGVGRTDAPRPIYAISEMADDTEALLNALDIDKAHIMGLSMGGLIAQEFALKYPRRLKSLILATTAARLSPHAGQVIQLWQNMVQEDVKPETCLREMFLWVFTDKFFENDEQVKSFLNVFLNHPHPQPAHGFSGQAAACLKHDSLDRLGRITVPTLVIAGREDIFIPVKLSEELAAGIPNAELVVLEGGGHGFCTEIPEKFNRAVLDFLSRVEKEIKT